MKHRIAVVHNIVAPYRHPIFEEISQDPRFDVIVYYCSKRYPGRAWDLFPRKYEYKSRFLSGATMKGLFVNPGIIFEIIRNRFDAIVVGEWMYVTMQMAFVMGKLLNLPVILWTECMVEPWSFLGSITKAIRLLLIKRADALIVPGRLSRDYVIAMGAHRSRVFIAPNCIDTDFFIKYSSIYRKDKESLRKELKVDKEKVILYVGQLIERKGVDYLIRAYARLKQEYPEIALILIGDGPLLDKLKRKCSIEGISDVYFVGSGLRLLDLIKYYSLADFFVLPTLFDVWGFVINEAMACGLPVISTRNAQAAVEMIRQGENGLVVNAADEEELYSAMKELINSRELEVMRRNSLEIISTEFDLSVMKEAFVEAINCSLSGRSDRLRKHQT